MPTRGKVTAETTTALLAHMDGFSYVYMPCPRKPVAEARNLLAQSAKLVPDKSPFIPADGFWCLWVDDDAFWRPGTLRRAFESITSSGVDVLAGYFCARGENAPPAALYLDETAPRIGEQYEHGDIVGVDRIGFHFVLHRLELLEKLGDDPFTPNLKDYPDGGGEDYAFCDRVRAIGGTIAFDSAALVAHVDDDGKAYLPYDTAYTIVGGQYRRIISPERVRQYT